MRILFVTIPFRAHLYLQVPLASALRTAGHQVVIASAPDLMDTIAQTGVPGIPVGNALRIEELMAQAVPSDEPMRMDPSVPFDKPLPPCDERGLRTGRSAQGDFGWGDPHIELEDYTAGVRYVLCPDSTFEDTVNFARRWQPDLVISDTAAYFGPVAAQAVGAAHARIMWSTDRVAQLRNACRPTFDSAGDPHRDWLGPILRRYGCEFSEATVLGQFTINPSPPWIWQPEGVHYVSIRNMAHNGPSIVQDWVFDKPERRRVCITQGISHSDLDLRGASPVQALLDAVADLDAEVIATLNTDQLGSATVPDNVRAVDFVPLNFLLPTCSAFVHEGGTGAYAGALEHGVPQVLVPNDFKVEKWGGPLSMGLGLEARGAGIYAGNSSTFTADALRDSLKLILDDPSYADNAAQLQREVKAMPTPNDVVPVLEKLTAEYRTHS